MIKNRYNNLWIGLLAGLLLPVIVMFVFYLFSFYGFTIKEFIHFLIKMEIASKFLVLAVISNLLVFFLFIRLNYFYSARGVVLATILFALFSMIL